MRDKYGIYDHEVEPVCRLSNRQADCKMIDHDEEVDSDEEAQG